MINPLDHPLPQRISHWLNLVNFTILGLSGLFIHYTFAGISLNFWRNLHFIFMYLLLFNGVVRFYYSFFGRYKDYKDLIMNKNDWKNLWPQIKYYLFIGKHPQSGKYNPLQKLAYMFLPILTLLLGVTGVILYWPEWLSGWAAFFGGLAAVRGLHFLSFWLVIAIVIVHLYLVFAEASEHFWYMFFGKNPPEKRPENEPT